jgi:hypothetical protein
MWGWLNCYQALLLTLCIPHAHYHNTSWCPSCLHPTPPSPWSLDLRLQAVNVDALCHPAVQAQQAPPRQPQGALGPDTGAQPPPPWVLTLRRLQQLDVSSALSLSPAAAAWLLLNGGCLRRLDMSDCRTLAAGGTCLSSWWCACICDERHMMFFLGGYA